MSNAGFQTDDTHTENMKEDCTLSPLIHSKDVFRKLTDSLGKDG